MRDEFIDEESIIENKPAIKNYWESKMRESNAASQFARSNFGVASPQTIIDKMNEEIREDYLRNLELLHDEGLPNSSASETSEPIEFDSFDMASNGSSPYGQLMAESPTLIDSGHQSQESHLPPDPDHDDDDDDDDDAVDVGDNDGVDNETSFDGSFTSPIPATSLIMTATSTQNNTNHQGLKRTISNPFGTDYMGLPKLGSQPQPPQQQQAKFIGNSRVVSNGSGYRQPGKIENHVTHYIAFNKPFSVKVKPFDEPSEEKEVEQSTTKQPKEIVDDKFISQEQSQVPAKSTKSDISYLLATSRLKKEIEDNLKRERELKEQGRVKSLSVVETESSTLVPSQAKELEQQQQTEKTVTQKNPSQLETEKRPSEEPDKRPVTATVTNQNQKEEPQLVKKITQVEKSGSTNHNDNNVNNDVSSNVINNTNTNSNPNPSTHPVDNAKLKLQQQTFNSLKIGKNFNSLERYIMYSSMTKLNFKSMPPVWSNKSADNNNNNNNNNGGISPTNNNSNANFEFDDTPQKMPEHPLAVTDEARNQDEAEPIEKIRKNYVPTEKRIKDELLEMVQREEELKKTRQSLWKSTPNLSNLNIDDEEEHQNTQEDAPIILRRQQHPQEQSPRVGTEKRRRSALISKWEEMIQSNNPN